MADKTTYPRIPEKNWWALRAQFMKTIPGSVTNTYLKSLLGLSSEKSAANLIPPLRQLGLIDAEGKPTPRANDWRTDSKYDAVCESIVRELYPRELIDLYSGSELDTEACKGWFLHTAALGGGAARQCAAMYVLLNTPIDKVDDDTKVAKPVSAKPKRAESPHKLNISRNIKTAPQEKPQEEVSKVTSAITPSPSVESGNLLRPSVHIDLQIHISPEADATQIDSIFASMAKHLYSK
ncbi:MAG: DUF5343 domain-containing protein [Bacilli bacterium]